MAIPFLNHLDLRSVSELQNAILHKTTSGSASDVEGKIIYDTGSDTIKFYNGSAWISLGAETNTTYSTSVVSDSGIKLRLTGANPTTTDDIVFSGAGAVAVTRTDASTITITGTNTWRGVAVDTDGNGTADNTLTGAETLMLKKGTNITLAEAGGVVTISSTDTQPLTTEQVQDIAGPLVATGGTKTGISVTYDDDNNNMDFVVASQTDENFTTADHSKLDGIEALATADQTNAEIRTAVEAATDSNVFTDNDHSKLDGIEALADVTDKTNVSAALATLNSSDTLYVGDADDDTTVVIRGTLQVDGTTTTVNSETLTVDDNKIVLNDNQSGSPTEDAGIIIERGDSTNVELRWNEADDDWEFQAYNHAGTPALITYKIPTTYKEAIGDGSALTWNVDHNLGTRHVIVQLYDSSSYETVHADVVRTNNTRLVVTFAEAPATDDITVLVSKVV